MPDEELFELARRGTLHRPEVLEAQVRRMLEDPKADALVENFAGQWLQTPQPQDVQPRPGDGSPSSTRPCARPCSRRRSCSSRRSSRRTAASSTSSTPTSPSSTSGWRGTTASTDVEGDEFRRVALAGRSARRAPDAGERPDGHLEPDADLAGEARQVDPGADPRHAAAAPAARRAGAERRRRDALTGTLRQRMEQHRADPNCASCHARMDPLGFGFENFDAIGAWREHGRQVPDRPLGQAARRGDVRGAGGAEGDPQGEGERVRALPGREDADLRPGPRAGRPRPVRRRSRSSTR